MLGVGRLGLRIVATVDEGLQSACDVLVDTSYTAVRSHVDLSIARGVACVVGSSGLTEADYSEIDAAAQDRGVGVIASGNFSVMMAILQHSALLAARHLDSFEVVDYASAEKPDVPSGTSRELAERLAAVQSPRQVIPPRAVAGPVEARGATVSGVHIHSVRLPGIRCRPKSFSVLPTSASSSDTRPVRELDRTSRATVLAIREVTHRVGLTRGLDRLLLDE